MVLPSSISNTNHDTPATSTVIPGVESAGWCKAKLSASKYRKQIVKNGKMTLLQNYLEEWNELSEEYDSIQVINVLKYRVFQGE